MLFGIQASRDIKLSEIARSLSEDIKLIKTANRLSRNLQDETMYPEINKQLINECKVKIDDNTVLALDLTDISKPYAKKMAFLSSVWDGMNKKLTHGYWVLEVVGANVYKDYIYPLYSELYSQSADDFESENKKILSAIDTVNNRLNGKGVWVMDRGGDRRTLIRKLTSKCLKFIIRIGFKRSLILYAVSCGEDNRVALAKEIVSNLDCSCRY